MENNENSVGPVIATVIILAVIILGGLYFWGERSGSRGAPEDSAQITSDVEEATAVIKNQSDSDETSSIEADLNNTNVDGLDASLDAS